MYLHSLSMAVPWAFAWLIYSPLEHHNQMETRYRDALFHIPFVFVLRLHRRLTTKLGLP